VEESKEPEKAGEGKTYLQLQQEAQDREDARAKGNLQNAIVQLDDPFAIIARKPRTFESPDNTEISLIRTKDRNIMDKIMSVIDTETDTSQITDSNVGYIYRDPFLSGVKNNLLDVKRILNLLISDATFVRTPQAQQYERLKKQLASNVKRFMDLAMQLRTNMNLDYMYDAKFSRIIKRFYILLMSNKDYSANLTYYKNSFPVPVDDIIDILVNFKIIKPKPEPEPDPESLESIDVGDI